MSQPSCIDEYHRRRKGPWTDIIDHLPFLYETVWAREDPVVAELGVRSGESTCAFLAALEGSTGHLWSVDIAQPDVPLYWLGNPRWSFAQCDSVSAQAQAFIPSDLDVLFIDTSHDYGQTLAELRWYVPRVRKGGIALLHDTRWLPPAVSLPGPGGPVTEALNYFCQEAPYAWENRHGAADGYGLGVIRV